MHRTKPLYLSVFPLFVLWLFSIQASAGTFSVFGPKLYIRAEGAPVTALDSFTVSNINTSYKLIVRNGGLVDADYDRVSSTTIFVNGNLVVAENELNQNVAVVEKPVVLNSINTIQVQVRGKPGGALSIDIAGTDNDVPVVSAVVTPNPNENGWNHTAVTVTFSCSDATSGVQFCPPPVTLESEGRDQVISGRAVDIAGNSAEASINVSIDLSSPKIDGLKSPPPNSAGWNNSDVSVSYLCDDDLSGIATCPASGNITAEGVDQSVTGIALDRAGNEASTTVTANIDKTPPTLIVATPADGSFFTQPYQTINGSLSDAASGVSSVSCGSATATISGEAFTCSVTLVPGINQITITGSDVAGNSTSSSLNLSLSQELDPPPHYLLITPSAMTLVPGQSRRISLVDDYGRTIYGASWTVSDLSILNVSSDGTGILAGSPGQAVITATFGQLNTQATVSVLDAPSVPEGTAVWNIYPVPSPWYSPWIRGFSQAPFTDDDMPTIYTRENIYQSSVIRGFRSDGTQIFSVLLGTAPNATPYGTSSATFASATTASATTDSNSGIQEYLALADLEEAARTAVGTPPARNRADAEPDVAVATSAVAALRDWIEKTGGDPAFAARWLATLTPETISAIRRSSSQPAAQRLAVTQSSAEASATSSSLPDGVREFALESASTGDGGVLLRTLGMTDGWPTTYYRSLVKVDPRTRNVLWRYPSVGSISGRWAMHADGTIFSVEDTGAATAIVAVDGATGAVKYKIPIPQTHMVDMLIDGSYDSQHCLTRRENFGPSSYGSPMIGLDGNMYITYSRIDYAFGEGHCLSADLTYHGELGLIRVSPGGSYTTSILDTFDFTGKGREYINYKPILQSSESGQETCPLQFGPGETVSTGSGSMLTEWSEPEDGYCFNHISYNFPVAHFLPISGQPSSATQPMSTISSAPKGYTLPVSMCPTTGVMVTGEGEDAFASCSHVGLAFDASTGASKWQAGFDALEMYSSTDHGLVVVTNDYYSGSGVTKFDAQGTPSQEAWPSINGNFFRPLEFATDNMWLALDWNNNLAAVRGTKVDPSDSTWYAILAAQKRRAASMAPPQLDCTPTTVNRGEAVVCSVKRLPAGSALRWKFSSRSGDTVEESSTASIWKGSLVQEGSVTVQLTKAGKILTILGPVGLSVTARQDWAFAPVKLNQPDDNFVCPASGNVMKTTRPVYEPGELAEICIALGYSYVKGGTTIDSGPNRGYRYFSNQADISDASKAIPFYSAELQDGSAFCTAQCPGTHLSCSTLRANVKRHEESTADVGGKPLSHYQEYVAALREKKSNHGVALEAVVAAPGQDFDARVTVAAQQAINSASVLIAIEPPGLDEDENGNIIGFTNFADRATQQYPSCPR